MAVVLAGCGVLDERASEPARVIEVVDGDTIVVEVAGQARTVRILGVDTPETKKPGTPVQCFGPEASAFSHDRLDGRMVTLRYDVERTDRYGRTLAAVRVDGVDHAAALLAEGYARLLVIAPNGRDAKTYLALELEAQRNRNGLWGVCGPRR